MIGSKAMSIEQGGWPRAYPYLLVRIFGSYYARDRIRIQQGMPFAMVAHGASVVRHPAPISADGSVDPACREVFVRAVQRAMHDMAIHRMCVVWAVNSCTIVEGKLIHESTQPPSGRPA